MDNFSLKQYWCFSMSSKSNSYAFPDEDHRKVRIRVGSLDSLIFILRHGKPLSPTTPKHFTRHNAEFIRTEAWTLDPGFQSVTVLEIWFEAVLVLDENKAWCQYWSLAQGKRAKDRRSLSPQKIHELCVVSWVRRRSQIKPLPGDVVCAAGRLSPNSIRTYFSFVPELRAPSLPRQNFL